ncbi:hypothetical protein [Paracoccus tibetensis]|uniref:hypothetical protein n=1 Tax=Paracoccus tibetensis TaxID=336292 RepID=UPI000B86047A|nr:hypothetical protein [Paracoccus tibetensis]
MFLIGAIGLSVLALLHLQPSESDRTVMRIYAPWVPPEAAVADAVATGRSVEDISWGGWKVTLGPSGPEAQAGSIRRALPFLELRAGPGASCLARL